MKLYHLRNATFVIESGANHILIDPMLSGKGELPPFAHFRHKPERNPTVPLPDTASRILDKVTLCLITHSQLKHALEKRDLLSKTFIPNDGETITIEG